MFTPDTTLCDADGRAPTFRAILRLVLMGLTLAGTSITATAADDFILVRDDLSTERVELLDISAHELTHRDAQSGWRTVPLEEVVAIMAVDGPGADRSEAVDGPDGLVELNDGQRLPGEAISGSNPEADVLAWEHPWLRHLELPLERIASVRLVDDAALPEPGVGDRVQLVNGDVLEGFILGLNDPVLLEVDGEARPNEVSIPRSRVAAVRLVPIEAPTSDTRVWFEDGTVIDVTRLTLGDDGYFRLVTPWTGSESARVERRIEQVAAVLLMPGRLQPLAALEPSSIEGPPTRYRVPEPQPMEEQAALDLRSIEYRGPLTVRYPLPGGPAQLAATVRLAEHARVWGDLELVVLDDDREVFRARLNGEQPSAPVRAKLQGSELTLMLLPGEHGPIQDHVILERPMLLRE